MGANTVEITDTNFESEVEKSNTSPVLVDFWAALVRALPGSDSYR